MGTQIKFTDNSDKVKAVMEGNKKAALAAMGITAVGMIVKQMQSGYQDPHPTRDSQGRLTGGTHTDIRFTGDLMRDVNAEVENSGPDTVDVGNSLGYALFVHEGTSKLKGRQYIKDAITNGTNQLQEAATKELKKGF